jgi:hypothetical protein
MTYEVGDSIVAGPVTMSTDLVPSSSFTGDVVIFLPTGTASESGRFDVDISGGGALYSVSVLASTGRSRMQ